MQRREVMGRPFSINLEAKQVADVLHLLLQNSLAGLDRSVGLLQRLEADDRLSGHLGAFILAQGDAVVALQGETDFVAAGHCCLLAAVSYPYLH